MIRRVALVDPSPEGDALAYRLASHGFEVVRLDQTQVEAGLDAHVLIIAGELPGALPLLRSLGDEAGSSVVPLVLIGAPTEAPFDLADAVYLGAHAFYPRPVAIERLVRKLQSFFAGPEGIRLSMIPSEAPPVTRLATAFGATEVPALPPMPQRERTQVFNDEDQVYSESPPPQRERTMNLETDLPALRTSPSVVIAPSKAPDSVLPKVDRDATQGISDRLEGLFQRADRRVFPSSPPLGLHFDRGFVSPETLVPSEVVEGLAAPVDLPMEEDPMDVLTYVGPMPGSLSPTSGAGILPAPKLQTSSGRTGAHDDASRKRGTDGRGVRDDRPLTRSKTSSRSRSGSTSSVHPITEQTLADFSYGDLSTDGAARTGRLSRDELAELIAQIVTRGQSVVLTLTPEGKTRTKLVFDRGTLRWLDADVALRVLHALQSSRGLVVAATNEADAEQELVARVQAKSVTLIDVERQRTRAMHACIEAALEPQSCPFSLSLARDEELLLAKDRGRVADALGLLVAWARAQVAFKSLFEALGGDGRLRIQDEDLFAQVSHRVEPEIAALLRGADGERLRAIASQAAPELGLAGALWIFARAGACALSPLTSVGELTSDDVLALRETMRAWKAKSEEGDYFALLDLPRESTAQDIADACERRRAELERLPLLAYGLQELAPDRDRAIAAVQDAAFCLLDDATRDAYVAAISL